MPHAKSERKSSCSGNCRNCADRRTQTETTRAERSGEAACRAVAAVLRFQPGAAARRDPALA